MGNVLWPTCSFPSQVMRLVCISNPVFAGRQIYILKYLVAYLFSVSETCGLGKRAKSSRVAIAYLIDSDFGFGSVRG